MNAGWILIFWSIGVANGSVDLAPGFIGPFDTKAQCTAKGQHLELKTRRIIAFSCGEGAALPGGIWYGNK